MVEEAKGQGLNARQRMLRKKGAFSKGSNLAFPSQDEIRKYMDDNGIQEPIDAYGDGSFTTPKVVWWAALGGSGVWFPTWLEIIGSGRTICAGAIGQDGSSTRQELAAWILAMTQPVTFKFATDSAAMLMTAREMFETAKERSLNNFMTPNVTRNPFGKE